MSEGNKIVEIIVGHTSSRLPGGPRENGHTHQWTLFVKPANKEFDHFPDNKFVQKVKFRIHESFPSPTRTVFKPPFKITETGFASFEAMVDIYLNLPHQKPHSLQYELVLFSGETDTQEEIRKLVIRDDSLPPAFLEQIKKYGRCKKRKASMASTHSGRSHSPQEKKPRKAPSEERKLNVPKIEVDSPRNSEKEKKKRRSKSPEHREHREKPKHEKSERIRTPEEVTKKVNNLTDPHAIYKISEFLLTLPKTTLDQSTLKIHFDLAKCSQETLSQIGKIIKASKKGK